MEFKAEVRFVRVAPRKLNILAREVRGKDINEAVTYLKMSPRKRAAGVLYTLLKSAAANADNKGGVDVDQLVVRTLTVGNGPILKRFRPRAKGAASRINKRTSHVYVTLGAR